MTGPDLEGEFALIDPGRDAEAYPITRTGAPSRNPWMSATASVK